jgi:hypothetical protein
MCLCNEACNSNILRLCVEVCISHIMCHSQAATFSSTGLQVVAEILGPIKPLHAETADVVFGSEVGGGVSLQLAFVLEGLVAHSTHVALASVGLQVAL